MIYGHQLHWGLAALGIISVMMASLWMLQALIDYRSGRNALKSSTISVLWSMAIITFSTLFCVL